MIHIIDNFIDKDLFKLATGYLKKGEFLKHKVGNKNFYTQDSPESFTKYVVGKLGMIEGRPVESILSFFRTSNDTQDTQWRIHSDLKIKGEHPEKWRLVSVAGYEQNRLISYPSNYFHSKYPNQSWKEGRNVYVIFYKFKSN